MPDQTPAERCEELYDEAQEFYEQDELEDAEQSCDEAIDLARGLAADEEDLLAQALNLKAGILRATDRDDEALPVQMEAMEVAARTRDADDPDLADMHLNAAQLLQNLDRHDEALAEFNLARDAKAAILGEDSPGLASALWGIAQTHDAQGEAEKAEAHYKLAIEKAKSAYALDALPRAAAAYAGFLEAHDREAEITPLLEDAVATYEKWLAAPGADDLNPMDFAEVELAMLKAQMKEQGHGPQSLVMLQARLAQALSDDERHDEAFALQEKVVKAFSGELGDDHEVTLGAYADLAHVAHVAGVSEADDARLAEAEKYYRKVLAEVEPHRDQNAASYALTLTDLAAVLLDRDDEAGARAVIDQAEAAKATLDPDEDEEELEELTGAVESLRERLDEE